jgi:hypothetical protein
MGLLYLAALALTILAPILAADEPRAQLSGTIRDSTDASMVHAIVTAQHEETGTRRTVESNDEGVYLIAGLAAGPYKVTVRKPGFQTIARLNFTIGSGEATAIDFTMLVGSVREVITITGDPPEVNADDGSVGVSIRRGVIDEIPVNGRGLHGIVDLAPGVVTTPATTGEAGQFATGGQRPNTNYFTIDGVSANTGVGGSGLPAQFWGGALPAMTAFGSTHNLVSFGELEEVRVQTSSFAPEFGRMPGAHVALTTRSGGNQLHGSLQYSLRHETLAARDWFANARALPDAPLRFHQGGTTLGGPVARNRTFFHASWEAVRLTQPYTWQSVVPTLEARRSAPAQYRPVLDAFPVPNGRDIDGNRAEFTARVSRPARLDSGSLRIDHALTSKVTLFGRYNQAPSSSESGYTQIDDAQFGYRSLTVGATSVHTPALSSEIRLNVSSASATSSWHSTGLGGARPVDLRAILPGADPDRSAVYGLAIGGLGDLINGEGGRNRQGQWNLAGTFAWNEQAHAVRFGLDYQRLTPARETAAQSVAGRFANLSALLAGAEPLVAVSRADQASSLIEMLSLFFQDTWRPNQRLSLTYGARWEITPAPALRQTSGAGGGIVLPGSGPGNVPFPVATSAQLWPTRYGQVAPRFGAAYRLTNRTVMRAGWGIFYDLGFSAATDPINGHPFNRWQFRTVSVGVAPPTEQSGGGRVYAPDLRLPYAHHWNAAIERGFGNADWLSLSYVGSAGRNLLRREGSPLPGTPVADVIIATNNGASDYHALQLQYRRRLARGLQGIAAYTWSHSLDNGSWDSAVALANEGYNATFDRASSSFDVRHAFSAALSYETKGWKFSTSVRARSGFPIDVLTTSNLLGLGFDNITRPDIVAGVPVWVLDPGAPGGRRLNPAAFGTPAGLQGNLGRNAIGGLGMWQTDASVSRRFSTGESSSLEVRLEAFNLTNRANFADPVRFLDHPLFGRSGSLLNLMLGSGSPRSGLAPLLQTGAPRTVQVGLRWWW